jgi:aryl-alcohol dehydrogenase-like predicted oxidoreductase
VLTVPGATIVLADTEVPRIGLGTNRLRNTAENIRFLDDAGAAGLRHIDTAHVYTGGESEQTIGAAAPNGGVVATKGGHDPGTGRTDVLREQIEESLRRLQTEQIALYYLHRVDPETPIEESVAAIAGHPRVRHLGLSNVGVAEIERARTVAPVAAVQNAYSVTERRADDVVDYCAEAGIVFVAYYPLRNTSGPALAEIAARHEASEAQVALAWLLRRSPAVLPIPGTLSLEHLRENLGALEVELTDDEFEALR